MGALPKVFVFSLPFLCTAIMGVQPGFTSGSASDLIYFCFVSFCGGSGQGSILGFTDTLGESGVNGTSASI